MKKNTTITCLLLGIGLLGACQKDIQSVSNQPNPNISSQTIGNTIVHKLMIEGKPTYINEVDNEYFLASDITITKEQFNKYKSLTNNTLSSTERSAIAKNIVDTWPYHVQGGEAINANIQLLIKQKQKETGNYNPALEPVACIPYEISEGIDSAIIKKAISAISSKLPILFYKKIEGQNTYMKFEKSDKSHSYAPLGFRNNQQNTIFLGEFHLRTICHEIMHSLGVAHEHSRTDRDQYIKIHSQNIPAGWESEYGVRPGFAAYGSFDFNSIMLYDGGPSNAPMMTKLNGDAFKQGEGNNGAPSDGDINGLMHLYQPVLKPNPSIENAVTDDNRITPFSEKGKEFSLEVSGINAGDSVYLKKTKPGDNKNVFKLARAFGKNSKYYHICLVSDNSKVLGIKGNSVKEGAPIEVQAFSSNNESQLWTLHNYGNDGFAIQPASSVFLRLDITGNAVNVDGQRIIIKYTSDSDYNKNSSQRFKFIPSN